MLGLISREIINGYEGRATSLYKSMCLVRLHQSRLIRVIAPMGARCQSCLYSSQGCRSAHPCASMMSAISSSAVGLFQENNLQLGQVRKQVPSCAHRDLYLDQRQAAHKISCPPSSRQGLVIRTCPFQLQESRA